ncbi:MAG TPA: hypothetical protein VMZ53_10370 [Kofleriaceae bacterium]|nr:hypothetical protein [Kofleriaceae bacterium]
MSANHFSFTGFAALAIVASCARASATAAPAAMSASAPAASVQKPAAPQQGSMRGALAPLASEPLVVLPVQTLVMTVPDWSDKVGDPRAFLSGLDDEIVFAVRERSLRGKWAFAPDLARSAKRNPTYAVDPYTIALDPIKPVERDAEKIVGEPLAGQLRAFAGLFNARYALVPVELRLAPDASGGARATIHAVVIDTRSAKLTWKGDVSGDVVHSFSPAVAAGIAGRVADLFITPAR